jgi:hypothetical protein
MAEELPQTLEMRVLEIIKGAFKSREVWEAERPDDAPPVDDDRAMLQNWTGVVERQGTILAHLSVVPPTRAELMARMPGMANRVPAWLDAHLEGNKPMTWRLFMRGLAQMQTEHRKAIERVVAEQVAEAGGIEEALTEAPVPAGTDEEDRRDLMSGVFKVMTAHTKALVDIAYDLETQLRGFTDPGEED